ncbi:MAG: MBOAT family O-acyltransferase [Elusimicrobiota bacterium]
MNTSSLSFLAFLCAAATLFSVLDAGRWRKPLLSAVNAAFLAFFVHSGKSAALLAVFLLGGYACALLAERTGRRAAPMWILILPALGLLLYIKRYAILTLFLPAQLLVHDFEIVGLSYMTFKLIHVLVDARRGTLDGLSFPCYANYQLGFFTLLAGPIQRYNDFAAYWRGGGEPVSEADALRAWSRLLDGVIKSALLGTLALQLYERASGRLLSGPGAWEAGGLFLLVLYSYLLYIYLNFSGYCDVVVASARLLGLALPENFDRPFAARNMIDFWNRWHISLSQWIRDYAFMPSYVWYASRWDAFQRPFGYLLLFATLFAAGVWHGPTWNFVAFGVAQGLGVMLASMYGDFLQWALGTGGVERYLKNAWVRRTAVIVTFHYNCAAFLFFPSDLHKTASLLRAAAAALGGR